MKKTIKVRFGIPKHIPSSMDGIEILYPYELISSIEEKFRLPEESKSLKSIRVMISGSLAITWGFQIWQTSENYADLIKLLFVYALQEIKDTYSNEQLPDQLIKKIMSTNHPPKRLYDVNEIPVVNDYEEVLETVEINESINQESVVKKDDGTSPIVFISYSWDSVSHKEWIRNFADKLLSKGIEVLLDQYELGIGKSLNHFVENSLNKANKALIIFTPNYRLKADNRQGGVGYEYSIINNDLYRDQINNKKFIPILKEGSVQESIPTFMQQYVYLDLTNENEFDKRFEELVREIHNEPKYKKPDLGKKPEFE